jgi:molybdopterin converting factor small subunit
MGMRIEVRLFASLRAGRFKRQQVEVPDDARLRDVLRMLEIPEDEVSLPLINGRYSEMDEPLGADDVLSIFPAVGGG